MRVLIVHASRYSPAAEAAETLGDILREAGHDVVVWAARETPSPRNYSLVIAGGAVRSGRISRDLEHYFTTYRGDMASKSLALFATASNSRGGAEARRRQADVALLPLAQGMRCIACRSFVVRKDLRRMPLPLRFLARLKKTEPGDGWKDLRAWAADLAGTLAQ